MKKLVSGIILNGLAIAGALAADREADYLKASDEPTSFPIHLISSGDNRILSLTGSYDYLTTTVIKKNTTGTVSLRLNMTQDDRGRLTGNSNIVLSTGITTQTALHGRVKLAKKGEVLSFNVGGGRMVKKSENSSNYTGSLVRVKGVYNGESFKSDITVTVNGRPYKMVELLTPVRQDRGFIIEQTTGTQYVKGNKADLSTELPWGKTTSKVTYTGKTDAKINAKAGGLRLRISGLLNSDGEMTSVTAVKAKTGYGMLPLTSDSITVQTSGTLRKSR